MVKLKLHYWPVFTSIWFFFTFVISYVIAVLNEHVEAIFPFISDTGTTPPESCIFGQLLNFGALFMFVTMYIRYRLIQICEATGDKAFLKKWNSWSNLFGALACLGMSLVANFQETAVLSVHSIGALLAFGFGAIYFFLQTYITWLSNSSKFIKYVRILLSVLFVPIYTSTMVCSSLAFQQFDGKDATQWNSSNKGYHLWLAGTISEWMMAILMNLYIISFTSEFTNIEFDEICFVQSKYA